MLFAVTAPSLAVLIDESPAVPSGIGSSAFFGKLGLSRQLSPLSFKLDLAPETVARVKALDEQAANANANANADQDSSVVLQRQDSFGISAAGFAREQGLRSVISKRLQQSRSDPSGGDNVSLSFSLSVLSMLVFLAELWSRTTIHWNLVKYRKAEITAIRSN